MPLYEYKCVTCKRTIEQLQRMSDPDIVALVGCEEDEPCELVRIFSVCSLRLHGVDNYEPPIPKSPLTKPVITRDWMAPDGTCTPMKEGDYNLNFVGRNA